MTRCRSVFAPILRWVVLSGLILGLAGCQPFEVEQLIIIKSRAAGDIQPFSCNASGEIIDTGEGGIEQHGFCWGTNQNPTLENGLFVNLGKAAGTGDFSALLEDLIPNTTYYYRAFARGGGNLIYSQQQSFTTLGPPVTPPEVTTGPVTEIQRTSVKLTGRVVHDGGSEVSTRGFVLADHDNPTDKDVVIEEGSGVGNYGFLVKDLAPGTTYFVRAFAQNTEGTGVGEIMSFETLPVTGPEVQTIPVTNINMYSVIVDGAVIDDGGSEVFSRGFCWATHQKPTLDDFSVVTGSGTGGYQARLEGLETYTHYFVRAFATNEIQTSYGDLMEFRTLWDNKIILYDFDRNDYVTVQIGDQVWMGEYLRVTHFADGEVINLAEDANDWDAMPLDFKAYCYYDNDPGNAPAYGALYSWAAATNGHPGSIGIPSGVQGVCPDGWHLPSEGEWMQLEMFLGMSLEEAEGWNWRGKVEGNKLKSATTTHWTPPNEGATNSSGFHALPGGFRHEFGEFFSIRQFASMWTASPDGETHAFFRGLSYDESGVLRLGWNRKHGMSVRCLKDY